MCFHVFFSLAPLSCGRCSSLRSAALLSDSLRYERDLRLVFCIEWPLFAIISKGLVVESAPKSYLFVLGHNFESNRADSQQAH